MGQPSWTTFEINVEKLGGFPFLPLYDIYEELQPASDLPPNGVFPMMTFAKDTFAKEGPKVYMQEVLPDR